MTIPDIECPRFTAFAVVIENHAFNAVAVSFPEFQQTYIAMFANLPSLTSDGSISNTKILLISLQLESNEKQSSVLLNAAALSFAQIHKNIIILLSKCQGHD